MSEEKKRVDKDLAFDTKFNARPKDLSYHIMRTWHVNHIRFRNLQEGKLSAGQYFQGA